MASMTQNSIQLANIDKELTNLWNSGQGQKKIKASLFNLILYVQKTERADFYQTLIKFVVSKFPCRVLMIINDVNPREEYLRTSVSSETIGEGELKVFCEIIHIEVAGKLIERVPYILLPHILPDLPVYLLWTQDPATESSVLPYIEPFANRIIFDSESTENLQNYCHTVLSLISRFHCTIGDLNWSALSGWRTVIAQTFNTPNHFLSLAQSSVIRIQYNKSQTAYQKHTQFEAAYLQAWLASRLEWKFERIENNEGNIRVVYRRPLKEVVFLLTPQEIENQPPGSILAIDIQSSRNKGNFNFKKHPQTRQVYIQYSEKNFCQLPYASFLTGASEGQEIVEEIFYPSRGKHYREMLEVLANIPWKT